MMTIDDLKNVRRQKLRVETLQERIERLRSRAEYNHGNSTSAAGATRRATDWRSMPRSWTSWRGN